MKFSQIDFGRPTYARYDWIAKNKLLFHLNGISKSLPRSEPLFHTHVLESTTRRKIAFKHN